MMIFNLIISFMFLTNNSSLDKRVENYLNENLNDYSRIEYEIISIPEPCKNRNFNSKNLTLKENYKITNGVAYIPVSIKSSKHENISFIKVKVNLYKEVLVTKKEITRGSELKYNLFSYKETDVSKFRKKTIEDVNNINRYKSKVNIKKGKVLTENMIELIPLINIGDNVVACLTNGNVNVKFNAIAKNDGHLSSIIRIQMDNRQFLKAKVIDSKTVNIIE